MRPRQHSPDTVAHVRRLHADGLTQAAIADQLGLPRSTVARMVRVERRSDGPLYYPGEREAMAAAVYQERMLRAWGRK